MSQVGKMPEVRFGKLASPPAQSSSTLLRGMSFAPGRIAAFASLQSTGRSRAVSVAVEVGGVRAVAVLVDAVVGDVRRARVRIAALPSSQSAGLSTPVAVDGRARSAERHGDAFAVDELVAPCRLHRVSVLRPAIDRAPARRPGRAGCPLPAPPT